MSPIVETLRQALRSVVRGKDDVIDKVIFALLARGHVLLSDVPGTGKTTLAHTLAYTLDASFSRIQFTPDLLPSDITGVSVPDPKTGAFVFRPGPIFTHVLLADEINRAAPRTQSALLECMAESHVTADGGTYPLDPPFFVIATQNPAEMAGTFPLPEAQLDRFLLCVTIGYPDRASEKEILLTPDAPLVQASLSSKNALNDLLAAQEEVKRVALHEAVCDYLVDVAVATRDHTGLVLGLSTRGLKMLAAVCRAKAYVEGRDFVTPDDVKSLATDAIAHRLMLRGGDDGFLSGARQIVAQILQTVPVPKESLWKSLRF